MIIRSARDLVYSSYFVLIFTKISIRKIIEKVHKLIISKKKILNTSTLSPSAVPPHKKVINEKIICETTAIKLYIHGATDSFLIKKYKGIAIKDKIN